MNPADWLARAVRHYDDLAALPLLEDEREWHTTDLGLLAAQIATVPAEVHAELEARERAAEKHQRFMADLMRDTPKRPSVTVDPREHAGSMKRYGATDANHTLRAAGDDDRDDGWPVGSVEG